MFRMNVSNHKTERDYHEGCEMQGGICLLLSENVNRSWNMESCGSFSDLFLAGQWRFDDDPAEEFQIGIVKCKVDLDLLLIIFELLLWLHEDLGDEDRFGSDCVAWILEIL